MVKFIGNLKAFVAAICFIVGFCCAAVAQDAPDAADGVSDLLALLAQPDLENWPAIEAKIRTEWSRSGSASMDLLLKRAQDAVEAGDIEAALEHAAALTDHAPDFAEGWNLRASAYFQTGQYGPALDAIEHALALNPQHFSALRGLGYILDDMGYKKEALAAFESALAIHPHLPDLAQAIENLSAEVGGQNI